MSGKNAFSALVVDDSAFMRAVIKDILAGMGIPRIYEAKDGAEAVEIFSRYSPDLITLDIIMPGEDGLKTLERILGMDHDAKIIMVSSVDQQRTLDDALKLGAKDYVTKPFAPELVTSVVSRVLGQK
jgi:two-component system chemotaxis response regulator CheY